VGIKMVQEAIENFLQRIQDSQKTRSPEIRLTMQEAHDISIALAIIMGRNNSLLEQVVQLQDSVIKQNESITIQMDGGKF
jgi:hypothetical protein